MESEALSGPIVERARRPAPSEPSDLSQKAHRQLIGYLRLLLPFILFGLAGLRPTPGLPRWETLNSVSAYYYSGAVAAFVGVIFALALFLFTYRGYKNDRADRVVGAAGGICALGVALFPTGPPGAVSAPSWWSQTMGTIHYISAITLFIVFIVFSLWLFRNTKVPKVEKLPYDKRWRNRIYLICGVVMVASVLWAGSSFFTGAPIFWPETMALSAFAVSWLVKGYAYRPVFNAVRGALGR